MANSENQFKQGFSFSQWLDVNSPLVQGKVNKAGGDVPPEGNNKRVSAEWANLVDDLLLCAAENGIGGGGPNTWVGLSDVDETDISAKEGFVSTAVGGVMKLVAQAPGGTQIIDTRGTPVSIPTIVALGTHNFVASFTTTHNQMEMLWWTMVRQTGTNPNNLRMIFRAFAGGVVIAQIDMSQREFTDFHDESGYKGHGMMLGPYGGELEDAGGGVRQFHVTVENLDNSTASAYFFAFIGRAFTLNDTTLTDPGIPP